MKCKIDNCDRDTDYDKQQVCQKHYFRFMRYGTYELTRKPRSQFVSYTPNGYIKIFLPDHKLSTKGGFVFEHRAKFYDANYNKKLICEMCGANWTFRTYFDHVDHIDENKLNNELSNLRPLCNACNTRRNKRPDHERVNTVAILFNGETKTAEEWSRENVSSVCGATILRRYRSGQSAHDSITKPSKTYKSIKD